MRTKTKGQALTEFALILPLLLLLLLGVIEGARIAWAYITVQETAREAARYAVSGQPYYIASGQTASQGEPWVYAPSLSSGYGGTCVSLTGTDNWNTPTCELANPIASNAIDRVDAIDRVALQRAYGLDIRTIAFSSGFYTATGYYDTPGTLGVRVIGQTDETDPGTVDNAGKEGLNVLVQVYYNLEMFDPIYDAMVRAITGSRFIRLQGAVLMQNEGVDQGLGSSPPMAIVPPAPPSGPPPSGSGGTGPLIFSPDGLTFEVNSHIRVRLEQHTGNTDYDIYLGTNPTPLCTLRTDGLGMADTLSLSPNPCFIPPDFPPGNNLELYSAVSGTIDKVAGGVFITVTRITHPQLLVKDGNRWPISSTITLQLRGHDPHGIYDVYFNGTLISPAAGVTADEFGDADQVWKIPGSTAIRESDPPYDLYTLAHSTVTPTVASSFLYVTLPQVVVQGGTSWPAGSLLRANLRGHAPNHTYEVRCDGISRGTFTTDSQGRSTSTVLCTIPIVAPNSPPYYVIASYDNGDLIAYTNVSVSTPVVPYLVVVGGYDWPAGSPIEIQLFRHQSSRDYRIYFGPWTANPSLTTDGSGFAETSYVIPITATQATTYSLRSYDPLTNQTVASHTVTVRAAPLINVTEGAIVPPASTIHINLTGHAQNAVYDIVLNGIILGSVQTDNTGVAAMTYNLGAISLSGGPFILESRLNSTRAAQTTLSIVAADLAVTSIQVPANPVFNQLMPITITIRNNSTVAVSSQWFDTDIYVDPERAPNVNDPYPPGDFKLWLDNVGPNSTTTLVQDVVLLGAGDHRIYARTNTSAYVLETDAANPVNNMSSTLVVPVGCGASVDEALTSDSPTDNAFGPGWAGIGFGDGASGSPSASLNNDTISLTSRGRSTVNSNDSASSAGYYLYYQSVAGDFDVYVHALGQTGTASSAMIGLEVRDGTSSTARKVDLFRMRTGGLLYAYRNPDGSTVERDVVTGSSSNVPVWLRIARYGNNFTLYYSTTGNTPPQAGNWVTWATYTVPMGDSVLVGLVNASYVANTSTTATFNNLHMCIAPGTATTCGQVREQSGQVVLEATNYVQNVPRSSPQHQWQQVLMGGQLVMQALPDNGKAIDTNYATTSPELQYRVNIQTPGTYYVWVYGGGPDASGDTLHVGLDNTANSLSAMIDLAQPATTPAWTNVNTSGSVARIANVTAGVHTINVWMDEDGAWFNQILLTTNANYTPSGDLNQSACDVSNGQDPYPPGLVQCTSDSAPLLQNGGFEDQVTPIWTIPNPAGTSISSNNPNTGQQSLYMASYSQSGEGFKWPYAWQQFTMGDWITNTSTLKLKLWKSVDIQGFSEVTDTLKAVLRTAGATPTAVSTPTVIARGDGGADYVADEWDLFPAMRALGNNPASFVGQNLQLYFYDDSNSSSCTNWGPNCFWTDFYVDDVSLQLCTSQPIPPSDASKATIKGDVRVWLHGIPVRKQGVRVWAYKQNGAMYTTYSIQDATYGFYLMEPGDYVLYAEWWEGADLYTALTGVRAVAGATASKSLDLY
jgi:Flp pilus assembly protein TadG